MLKKHYPIIGITMGDPAGIGPEIIAKALTQSSLRKIARFQIIGSQPVYQRFHRKSLTGLSFFNVETSHCAQIKPGQPNRWTGQAALAYLQTAVELLKKKKIHALVTAPVSKEAVCLNDPLFQGHTEYLAKAFDCREAVMMFVADHLKTVILTRHIPLGEVPQNITPRKILHTLKIIDQGLKHSFKIPQPQIAVCGLNPHAGEGGHLGKEELTTIIPAIQLARKNYIKVSGPFAADSLFYPPHNRKFDCILAMYHDQGLIPIKTLYFLKTVNLTLGLPFIRTSPSHGTAFSLAGQNKADPSSMSAAIRLACQLSS